MKVKVKNNTFFKGTPNCVQFDQPQPLLAGFSFPLSVPPAPDVPPLQPLLELPAPDFSALQPLVAHPLNVKTDPDTSPAMHSPARIFFSSFVSMAASW
jgi:hypothetical protein